MNYKNILLIEIVTEELPIKNLKNIIKKFLKLIKLELINNFLYFSKIKSYVTLRRISCKINFINITSNNKIFKVLIKNLINKNMFFEKNNDKYYIFEKNIFILIPKILKNVLSKLIINNIFMKWGIKNYFFIRPIRNLLVLFNDKVIKFKIFNIITNNLSFGNKYIGNKSITIDKIDNYLDNLYYLGKVIVDYNIRKNRIIFFLKKITDRYNFHYNYSENFLDFITSMVEWPNIIIGIFNKKFLFLPIDIIIYVIQDIFKCLVTLDINNKLLNYFIIISNRNFINNFYIIRGYKKNVEFRLLEISKLYNDDRKNKLISYFPKLKNIIFYEKIGSLYKKCKRLRLISYKILNLINKKIDRKILFKSILLIKCDLISSLYKKYNTLKGIIGMYYSLMDKELPLISLVIKEHYYPRYNGDYIPTNLYSVIVSLSDKIDTLISLSLIKDFFLIKKSNDPYFLRRLSVIILNIILHNKIYINLFNLIEYIIDIFNYISLKKNYVHNIVNFIFKRSFNIFLKLNYDIKIINSFSNLGIYDILDIKNRIDSLYEFKFYEKFSYLIFISKRINNIIIHDNYIYNCNKINKKYLISIEEKKLFYFLKKFNSYSLNCFLTHNYNRFIRYLFISFKKTEIFLDNIKINVLNKNLRINRILILKKIKDLYDKFIDFKVFY